MSSDDDGDGGLILLIVIVWMLIGTCNSCQDSKGARDQAVENGTKLIIIDQKIDKVEKQLKELSTKKDTLIIY